MQETVYRVMGLVCALVVDLPIGTNLGLVHVIWMLLSGKALLTRGAIIPGLSAVGLSDGAVRRAWSALGRGSWTSHRLIKAWARVVEAEGLWQPHQYGGYHPVAVDITAFYRPRLQGCATSHYHAAAGKALPAIPQGMIARVGSVGAQRFGLLRGLVRADPKDPSPSAHRRMLLERAVELLEPTDVLVTDREFTVGQLLAARAAAWVTRLRKDVTARRADPPPYGGRGRPATYGDLVRPLARRRGEREIAATPPDQVTTWTEHDSAGDRTLRAEQWFTLVLPDAAPGSPTFTIVAISDPAYAEPLLVATPLALSPQDLRELYRDRWPVEQLPLAAKHMLGAARQFVHEQETCQRLPELALLVGAILTYLAATSPAVPTGSWDRRPRRTPGRLRRVLGQADFPEDFPLPDRLRVKLAVTDHLPKGSWGQRCRSTPTSASSGTADQPRAATEVA
ncbi:MAG: hypothetical protein M3537_00465 [Chloroflexota bacterium]|nr:hypothetical protein [Chloroflexota bacterium]